MGTGSSTAGPSISPKGRFFRPTSWCNGPTTSSTLVGATQRAIGTYCWRWNHTKSETNRTRSVWL